VHEKPCFQGLKKWLKRGIEKLVKMENEKQLEERKTGNDEDDNLPPLSGAVQSYSEYHGH